MFVMPYIYCSSCPIYTCSKVAKRIRDLLGNLLTLEDTAVSNSDSNPHPWVNGHRKYARF